nr:hypothetical protein [Kofleriaceae bacterium]
MATETAPASVKRLVTVAAVIVAVANVVFFLLSTLYFHSKVQFTPQGQIPAFSDAEAMSIRLSFALVSAVIAAAAIGVGIAPRSVSHGIMMVLAPVSLAAGVAAATYGLPGVLAAAELILGTLLAVIVPLSWKGSRGAWSFVVAIAAVYAVVLFFGAPKVRGVLHVGLWTTLVLPGLNVVALVGLVKSRQNYRS